MYEILLKLSVFYLVYKNNKIVTCVPRHSHDANNENLCEIVENIIFFLSSLTFTVHYEHIIPYMMIINFTFNYFSIFNFFFFFKFLKGQIK